MGKSFKIAILPLLLFLTSCSTVLFNNVNSTYSIEYDRIIAVQDSTMLTRLSAMMPGTEFQYLGIGYGESSGGPFYMPDFTEAYRNAVESKKGDLLLTTNYNLSVLGFNYRLTVWGMVVGIKEE